jgi:transcriptional regulator with XRE-family HTH domain
MEVHPLLRVLADLVALPPRGRQLLRALLVEVDGDDAPSAAPSLTAPTNPTLITDVSSATNSSADRRQMTEPRTRTKTRLPRSVRARTSGKTGIPDLQWAELRQELLEKIEQLGVTHKTVAEELDLDRATVSRYLRGAQAPGVATMAKLREWVTAATPRPPPAPAAEPGETTTNGHDRAAGPRLSRPGEVLPPYKLTEDQRNKLGLILATDPAAIAAVASRALAQKAIDGQRLAPEIINRLTELIEQPSGNGAGAE